MGLLRRVLLAFSTFSTLAVGHETLTHQQIGNIAVAYLRNSPQYQGRPLLPGLEELLRIGAVHEDDFVESSALLGRFYFHFNPRLDFSLTIPPIPPVNLGLGVSLGGNCTSTDWGLEDAQCTASFSAEGGLFGFSTPMPHFEQATEVNAFRWHQDLTPDANGAPTTSAIEGVGYVVHLLEDLGSPAHARNDMHACVPRSAGFFYCNPFEKDNNGRIPSLQVALNLPTGANAIIPTTSFTSPEQFFQSLRDYVASNYFSYGTVFSSRYPGPCSIPFGGMFSPGCFDGEDDYIYGPCISASEYALTCHGVREANSRQISYGRRIAHKGPLYRASCLILSRIGAGCEPKFADIDTVIAQEQFDELAPVIVQHVAAFLAFYAPAITVTSNQLSGTSITSDTASIDCGSTCSGLFVNGSTVTLSAHMPSGYTVQWQGDCSGAAPTVSFSELNTDKKCGAAFNALGSSRTLVLSGHLELDPFALNLLNVSNGDRFTLTLTYNPIPVSLAPDWVAWVYYDVQFGGYHISTHSGGMAIVDARGFSIDEGAEDQPSPILDGYQTWLALRIWPQSAFFQIGSFPSCLPPPGSTTLYALSWGTIPVPNKVPGFGASGRVEAVFPTCFTP